ncbi:MAG: hypothetical protein IMY72_06835 [Bacteroidetes bacterium]|nr:hypothetical protein [Bacteroidota bacterium]
MVKETSLYNDLKKIVDSGTDLKDELNAITEYIYKKYNLRSYFCKIFASRWSFFAGDNDIYLSVKRFKISNEFGLIIEDKNVENEKVEILIKNLKLLLKN